MAILGRAWFPPDHSIRPEQWQAMVGGTAAGGVLELGKQGIIVSDAVVQDLNVPIMQEALELQDDVFKIADELGVGAEVRAAVYTIRGAQYAATIAGQMLPASAAAAGASVLTGIGGVAALGAIAVVGAIAFALFGSSDAEEHAAQERVKRAQAAALHLRDRLTLAQFAAEQDKTQETELGLAFIAKSFPQWGTPQEHEARAAVAGKLAAFYRRADAELDASARELFESLSNLARWQGALDAYAKLPQSKKDAVDVLFGKSAPRLPWQLEPKIKGETEKALALVHLVKGERRTVLAVGVVIAAALGGVAVAIWAPSVGLAILRRVTSSAGAVYTRAKGWI